MTLKNFGCCVLVLLCLCGPTGCWNPDHYPKIVTIPPDYVVWTSSPGNTSITKGDIERGASQVIGPNVESWKLRGTLLTGEVVPHEDPNPDLAGIPSEVGWFIIDLKTGNILKGMKKGEYEERLKALQP